jgi:hypothetical protein
MTRPIAQGKRNVFQSKAITQKHFFLGLKEI